MIESIKVKQHQLIEPLLGSHNSLKKYLMIYSRCMKTDVAFGLVWAVSDAFLLNNIERAWIDSNYV
jgi:hypothetical protein